MRTEIRAAFPDKQITIEVTRKKKKRSNPQNAYYWAVVVQMVRLGIIDMGERVTIKQAHDVLKNRFLKETKVDGESGEIILEYTRSTSDLSTLEMLDYIAQCQQFASEYLGVTIPDPAPT